MEKIETFYNAVLSSIHDSYFGQLALDASSLIKRLLKDREPSNRYIVDLGCGSGILAKELSEQGFKVLGVDISEHMLAIAKRKAPKAAFIHSSLFDFSVPLCNVVCAIGESINYVFHNTDNNDTVKNLFQHIYNQLKPKGYFIFDILTTEAQKVPITKVMENEQVTMIVQISVDPTAPILTREITFFTKEGDHYIKHKETHKQQLFDRFKIKGILTQIGFLVSVTENYNNDPFRQGHFAFICEK